MEHWKQWERVSELIKNGDPQAIAEFGLLHADAGQCSFCEYFAYVFLRSIQVQPCLLQSFYYSVSQQKTYMSLCIADPINSHVITK